MAGRIAGSYGIDAPYVPVLSVAGGVAVAVLGNAESGSSRATLWLFALVLFAQAVVYMHTTLRGKFLIWKSILAPLPAPGTILDVGCGRGMVLIETLMQFPDSRGTGIDLWRSRDQSGNDPSATMSNAEANGLADRVTLETGDMSAMPFADDSFDLVAANVAIQNIKDRELRKCTIAEIVRVTRPGGHIRIVDIQYTGQYRDDLQELGALDVTVRRLGLNGWFGNPFYASTLVSARKPD